MLMTAPRKRVSMKINMPSEKIHPERSRVKIIVAEERKT
jgi:hypothetical protein